MSATTRIDGGTAGRVYEIPDGTRYPSVTSILKAYPKPALVDWAARKERELVVETAADLYESLPVGGKRMCRAAYLTTLATRLPKTRAHQALLTRAGEVGTRAHNMIEWQLRGKVGKPPVLTPEAALAYQAFEAWRQDVDLKSIFIEQTVWSREWGFAGTMDLYAELNHEGRRVRAVLDWKTSRSIHFEHELQNAAYIHALQELGHASAPTWGFLVRFPKTAHDPGFEVRSLDPAGQADRLRVFLNVFEVWKSTQPAPAAALPTSNPQPQATAASNAFDFAA